MLSSKRTSDIGSNANNLKVSDTTAIVPEHERPSPVKPVLHVQLKFPAVFAQVAFSLQSWIPVLHSSTSEYQERIQVLN